MTSQEPQVPQPPAAPPPPGPSAPLYASPYYAQPYYGQTAGSEDGLLGSLDPLRLLRILRRRWLLVLLALMFFGSLGAFYLLRAQRIYKATALVELSVRRPRILTQQAAVIEDTGAVQSEEIFNTRLEKLRSRTLLQQVAARLNDPRWRGYARGEEFPELLYRGVRLSLLRRTRLVRIEFEHFDREFAAAACNAFAEAAEASAYDENRVASDAAVAWLDTQAASQKKELEAAEGALLKFRQDNNVDVLETRRRTVQEALVDYNKALVEIESKATREQDLFNALSAFDPKPENVGRLPSDVPRGEEIRLAMEKWMGAAAERDALLSRYTAKHPEVQGKEKMLALYREQTVDSLGRARSTVASDLALFKNQAESLGRKIAEQGTLASELELKIVESRTQLGALERSRDASDTAYRGILTRIQEARLAADETTATVKLVERAQVPTRAVKPKAVHVLALALFLGLAGGVGLALATDTLADHVTGPLDVEGLAGLKVLAMVPHVESNERRETARATVTHRLDPLAEAFAGLRAMLDSSQYKDRSRVILVASSIPEEGKTIASCNLAAALAKNGQRTLLIDFDLRRPRLAGIFPMQAGQRGLLEYLNSGEDMESGAGLAYDTDCANLQVIATRPVRGASPADLVGVSRVADLMRWARGAYQRIVIDAPPLGLVGDALALAAHADCVLIMVRPEVSRRRLVRHTASRFREAGVATLAAVVNDVDFTSGGYHAYGSYSQYGQQYGTPPA